MASQGSGETLVAKRYARAFFELADQGKLIDAVVADLKTLSGLLDESADLRRMAVNPLLSRAVQQKALSAIATKAGLSELTRNFLSVLAANRRLGALSAIIVSVQAEIAAARGEVMAKVTSATALSDKQQQTLTDKLKKALGSKVTLQTKIDPSILGGIMVRIGSRLIDNSVRTKLDRLHRALRGQSGSQEQNQKKMKEVA